MVFNKNIKEVRILAKSKAQSDKEDQVIFKRQIRTAFGYTFTRLVDFKGKGEIVRYTAENKRGDILQCDGDEKPVAPKSKPKSKNKVS